MLRVAGSLMEFIVFVAVIFLLLLGWSKRSRPFKRRRLALHTANLKRGENIIGALRTWRGPFREARILAYLRKIDPYVFEELTLSAFKHHGFNITRSTRYSGDGGIDGRVTKNGREFLVQVKRYRRHINKSHVHEFSYVLARKNVAGFFIHTGKTSKSIRDYARRNANIEIISGSRLVDWLTTPNDHI